MTGKPVKTNYLVDAFRRAEEPLLSKKAFIVTGKETLTFGEVAEKEKRLSRLFREAGIIPGDRVIIATRNELEASILFLSLLRSGIAAVNLDPDTKRHRFSRIVQITQPRGIFLDEDLADLWQPGGIEFVMKIKTTGLRSGVLSDKLLKRQPRPEAIRDVYPAVLEDLLPIFEPAAADLKSDAYILFTSGTTSDPKGVRISHRSLSAHLNTISRQFGYTPESKILNNLILSHADGMIQGPVITFVNGATLFRPMKFDMNRIGALLDMVHADRITHFIAVPTILSLIERLCKDRPGAFGTEDFRFIISTGGYLDARLWSRLEELFGTRITNVYGLTETVVGGFFSGPSDKDHCIGTIGRPVDCQAFIENDSGSEAGPNVAGELLIKGDNVMTGYLNSPEATAKVFSDGWLRTGDIAVRDKDGFYRIVGRKKNIIISGGTNIHPEEVTEVLKLMPFVIDAVTLGVPDDIWGERLVAAVSLDASGSATEEEMIAFCRSHLEEIKVPTAIHILPALPKGPVGKVQIERVKEIILKTGRAAKDLKGDLRSRIVAIAAHCFKVKIEDMSINTAQDDITGWDSLAHLEFITALEEELQMTFSPVEIMQIERLSDAWKIIAEKLC